MATGQHRPEGAGSCSSFHEPFLEVLVNPTDIARPIRFRNAEAIPAIRPEISVSRRVAAGGGAEQLTADIVRRGAKDRGCAIGDKWRDALYGSLVEKTR